MAVESDVADVDDCVAVFAAVAAGVAAGGVSKNIVLRRECPIVFRVLLVRGFSVGFFFSSLFDNVDASFVAPTSFRFRFWFTAVFFVSVFCGVNSPIGLCSGNNEGGANNFRFNGLSEPIAAVGGVAAAATAALFGATTTVSN